MKYDFSKIEKKWQKRWLDEKVYEPSFAKESSSTLRQAQGKNARKHFYNLMMFPYPSAEGLHVGNMYAFTGADIYGRFKRMQGYDVFEPIGLDGFGIHSENYALKIGTHPAKQAKISEKRFYNQLASIGNGFAWNEKLETYDPEYYKWTQWIFTQMFKKGLAYRKKQAVNWCPSCKTVLADEQVLQKLDVGSKTLDVKIGVCERCESRVIKRDLEQWFFRITKYAEKLLDGLNHLDWSERVKIAQKNWIGKSEGALIKFEIRNTKSETKPNYVLLHGFTGSASANFFPWLKNELFKNGSKVYVPNLPNSDRPKEEEQVDFVLKNAKFDKDTVILGHSLGSVVAMKVIEKLNRKIAGFVSVGGFASPKFLDHDRNFSKTFNWDFDFQKIKSNVGFVKVLSAKNDYAVPIEQGRYLAKCLSGVLVETFAEEEHFCAKEEPDILDAIVPQIKVFTTRPDTLFGATYLVLAPENQWLEQEIRSTKSEIRNKSEVSEYIKKARAKSDEERIAEGKDKTGIELKGVRAINPANGEEIPIWVADYVLGGYGTGAIMAVPAHDERDFEFARKFDLPIKMVICSHYPVPTCPVLDVAYIGEGHLVDSGKFDGMESEKAKWEITKFVRGERKVQYRLRDWLISRQRYWGPPIPLIFCENCAEQIANRKSQSSNKRLSQGELENPGWVAVPEDELPVKLPLIKNFKPLGTGKSPLATDEKFYKTKCPKCGGPATRETDVSDTFLDSAWYYLGYLILGNKNSKIKDKNNEEKLINRKSIFDVNKEILKKWLPVDLYTGGAEHSVLHLLYVRFMAKVFHDWGLVDFSSRGGSASGGDEPAKKFRAHGLLINEGAKMSKSKGNVINPDEYIEKFGADALRMYLMFLAPFEQGGDFRDSGILGVERFLQRVWRLFEKLDVRSKTLDERDKNFERLLHKTIKKVTEDIETLNYNTAVSAMMILLNEMEKQGRVSSSQYLVFLKLLAPFAPHLSEELYQQFFRSSKLDVGSLKQFKSVHISKWPKYDPKLIVDEKFTLVIQINGKVRDSIEVEAGIGEAKAKELALASAKVKSFIGDKTIKKVIFVPGRLINLVV